MTKKISSQNTGNRLWNYYDDCGIGHVAAYLTELDYPASTLKRRRPKTPASGTSSALTARRKTPSSPIIDALGRPEAVTLTQLIAAARGETAEWLVDRRNRRSIPHRLERAGYVSFSTLIAMTASGSRRASDQ